MAEKAKHAFGNSENIATALQNGIIDAHDILFLDENTDVPKVGWIGKDGNTVIVDTEKIIVVNDDTLPEIGVIGKIYIFKDNAYIYNGTDFIPLCKPTDLTGIESQVEELGENISNTNTEVDNLKTEMETKVNAEKVQEMIDASVSSEIEIIEF